MGRTGPDLYLDPPCGSEAVSAILGAGPNRGSTFSRPRSAWRPSITFENRVGLRPAFPGSGKTEERPELGRCKTEARAFGRGKAYGVLSFQDSSSFPNWSSHCSNASNSACVLLRELASGMLPVREHHRDMAPAYRARSMPGEGPGFSFGALIPAHPSASASFDTTTR